MSVSYLQEQIDAFLRQKNEWVRSVGANFQKTYNEPQMGNRFLDGTGTAPASPDNASIAKISDHTLGILESTLHSQVILETMAMHLQNISDSLAEIAGQKES